MLRVVHGIKHILINEIDVDICHESRLVPQDFLQLVAIEPPTRKIGRREMA